MCNTSFFFHQLALGYRHYALYSVRPKLSLCFSLARKMIILFKSWKPVNVAPTHKVLVRNHELYLNLQSTKGGLWADGFDTRRVCGETRAYSSSSLCKTLSDWLSTDDHRRTYNSQGDLVL